MISPAWTSERFTNGLVAQFHQRLLMFNILLTDVLTGRPLVLIYIYIYIWGGGVREPLSVSACMPVSLCV